MAEPPTLADLQTKAEAHLTALFRHHGVENDGLLREILGLASNARPNPLKDLFCAPVVQKFAPAAGPSILVRPRSSKFTLPFGRSRDKERQPKDGSSTAIPLSSESSKQARIQQNLRSLLGTDLTFEESLPDDANESPGPANGANSLTYSCVFCDKPFSSKGTCKRHLDDRHVARKWYQCIGKECRHESETVPQAKKHSAICKNPLGWQECRPPPRKLYSSPLTNEVFEGKNAKQQYLDHLLDMGIKSVDERPNLSYHLKLRNLLGQPAFYDTLHPLSRQLFGTSHGWRTARWAHDRVCRAIDDLEYGLTEEELCPGDLLRLRRKEDFLKKLFEDRLSAPATADSPAGERKHMPKEVKSEAVTPAAAYTPSEGSRYMDLKPDMHQATSLTSNIVGPYMQDGTDVSFASTTEFGSKRPLSYESASRVPERHPPGPTAFDGPFPPARNLDYDMEITPQSTYEHVPDVYQPPGSGWHLADQPPPPPYAQPYPMIDQSRVNQPQASDSLGGWAYSSVPAFAPEQTFGPFDPAPSDQFVPQDGDLLNLGTHAARHSPYNMAPDQNLVPYPQPGPANPLGLYGSNSNVYGQWYHDAAMAVLEASDRNVSDPGHSSESRHAL